MTNTVKYGLGLLGVGIPAAAGSPYLIRHLQRPNTLGARLEFDGYQSILDGEENKWKAKFIDYRADIKAKVTELSNVSDTETSDDIGKLKDWCQKEADQGIKGTNYDDYLRLCSSNYKTIKAKLVSENRTPASTDDDFKLLFLFNKYDNVFLSRVNGPSSSQNLTRQSAKDNAHPHVKTMCEALFVADVDDQKYMEASMWCVKLEIETVEKRMNTLSDFEKLSDSDYDTQHSRWSSLSNYSTIVNPNASSTTVTRDNLKTYCQGKYSQKLLELTNHDEDLKNVYNLCNKQATWGASALREVA